MMELVFDELESIPFVVFDPTDELQLGVELATTLTVRKSTARPAG